MPWHRLGASSPPAGVGLGVFIWEGSEAAVSLSRVVGWRVPEMEGEGHPLSFPQGLTHQGCQGKLENCLLILCLHTGFFLGPSGLQATFTKISPGSRLEKTSPTQHYALAEVLRDWSGIVLKQGIEIH